MIDWIRISIPQIACSLGHSAGLGDIAFITGTVMHTASTEKTHEA